MKNKQGLMLLAVGWVVFLAGCDNNKDAMRSVLSSEYNKDQAAWLHQHLPKHTVAYLNVPTPWGYLFTAKADALQGVQSLSAHQDQVHAIKQGIDEHYMKFLPENSRELFSLLLRNMQSSLELALINYSESALMPSLAMATHLGETPEAELVQQVKVFLQSIDPNIQLTQLPQQPVWTFNFNSLKVLMRYEENTGKWLLLGGMAANEARLMSIWNDSTASELADIQELSNEMDPSGLNLKLWLAPEKMLKLGGALLPPEQKNQIEKMALDQIQYLWIGSGSAHGQAGFSVHAMMPETGWRLYLPRVTDWFDVDLAGVPQSVWQFSLPTAAQLEQGLSQIKHDSWALDEAQRKDMEVLVEFEKYFGFTVEDFLNAHGQQIYRVNDESGTWMAMKVNDRELYEKISERFYELYETEPVKREYYGQEIYEMHFSMYQTIFKLAEDKSSSAKEAEQWMGIFQDHMYWYEKEGVVYLSYVPQVLAQKLNHSNPIPLSAWLQQNQGTNWRSALFAYGMDIKGMPQALYHSYLRILQYIGDLSRVKIDLFALPTAEDMNLPDQGRFNFAITSDPQKVSMQVGYEYAVFDPLITGEGGLVMITTAAILAAYAIPAYRDYTVRAKVGEQLAMSGIYKITLSEHWQTTGSFEGVKAQFDLTDSAFDIDEDSGTIVIDLQGVDAAFADGDVIYLVPEIHESHVTWQCSATIRDNYLPAQCR